MDVKSVGYERCEIPYQAARRRRLGLGYVEASMRWPAGIPGVRRALPKYLWNAAPPGTARRGSWAVIAKVAERAIAFAWIIPSPGSDSDCVAEEVAVLPEWQGNGIGPACLIRVLAWMEELGYRQVAVLPMGWATTVERMGFRRQDFGMYAAAINEVTRRCKTL